MNTGLDQAVVLVTGASAGVGRSIAHAFAAEGARVAATYRHGAEAAEALVGEIVTAGGEAVAICLDLDSAASIEEAFVKIERKWGRTPSVLVNNAVSADHPFADFGQLTATQTRAALRVNLEGTLLVTQSAVRGMRADGFGRIVMISSVVAEDGLVHGTVYGTTKAALLGATRSLARELGRDGIFVNAVMPGLVELNDGRRFPPPEVYARTAEATPTGRLTKPEEVAQLTVFLGSKANGHINGEMIRISGGPSALS